MKYATPTERTQILKDLKMDNGKSMAPVLHSNFKIAGLTLDQILKMAEGFSTLKKDVQREGIVFKSQQLNKKGHLISFKSISNIYLLKKG